jgi:hypothetical protein
MASSISLPRVESGNGLLNALSILPGVLLLAGIGYAAKVLERTINAYAKAHHWTFPTIEYVLWAILIGLVISNTLAIPKIFQSGIATDEFWLKTWDCSSGRALRIGGRSKTGRHQPGTGRN